ncbi:hypothetical protein JOM56_003291 [Amanita muscaria]
MKQLPDESLALCYDFMHIRDVLVCRRVCKRMKYVIDSNPLLQIRVQLHVNNMVDSVSNTIPLRDQLNLLADYRTFECYGHGKWSNIPYPFIHDSSIAGESLIFKGSTLVMRRYGSAELYVAQTPSTFRRRPFREWRVTLPSAPIYLAFDPYRDMLVTVERSPGSSRIALNVRRLTDGTPLRVTNRIDPPKETIHEKVSIYGRYVALEWSSASTGDKKLEVWEWQTGYPVVFPDSVNVKSPFVFLSHRYILTGEVNMYYNRCAELNIVDVHTSSKTIVCHLKLPRFAHSISSWDPRIHISADDRPPQLTTTSGEVFVTSSRPRDKVVRVTLEAGDERMEFYILTSTLLKWAGQRSGPLKWENWGAKNTRLVSSKVYPPPTVAIYGTRVFLTQHTLTIYDFNQRPIELESAQGDNMTDVRLDTIAHPTDIFNPSMFEQSVTTCLPFRWTTVDIKKPETVANTQIYPGEDSLVAVSVGEGSREAFIWSS